MLNFSKTKIKTNISPQNKAALYVHIPFCERRCPYCAFSVEPVGANRDFLERRARRYVEALKWEIAQWQGQFTITTVYFGGGTPSVLPLGYLAEIVSAIRGSFVLEGDREWTIEAHPKTLLKSDSQEKISGLKNLGFNRVSLGLESLRQETLKRLYRDCTLRDVESIVQRCRDVGLNNINFDLICGWPWEKKGDFLDTLKLATSLEPDHLSLYPLQIEEKTAFDRKGISVDNVQQAEDFLAAHAYLSERGWDHYEIANYAKEGFYSLHNLTYWHYGDYLGLGLGAASKIGTRGFKNFDKFSHYLRGFETKKSVITEDEELTEEENAYRKIILGLRLKDGVPTQLLNQMADAAVLADFTKRQLLKRHNGQSFLTPKGWLISNRLFSAITCAVDSPSC